MRLTTLLATLALAAPTLAGVTEALTKTDVPHLQVPSCPAHGTASFDRSVPDKSPSVATSIDLCYTPTTLHLTFNAYDEKSFYYNSTQGTNDDIWAYEVMEAFIAPGTADPQTYLEFEVNPNNVTYQAFVFNPSKERADGAAFEHAFLADPSRYGLLAKTKLDREAGWWRSEVEIPLGLWNVEGEAAVKGSQWRMNFFRTVTSEATWPDQNYTAWGIPDKASFHISRFFGKVEFV